MKRGREGNTRAGKLKRPVWSDDKPVNKATHKQHSASGLDACRISSFGLTTKEVKQTSCVLDQVPAAGDTGLPSVSGSFITLGSIT